MYLKSLEIHGFKSFANKIIFDFHNGITGIVGPNGSGKSNVADAVRWVLGEQSAKQLRGSSMQDVIFAGTENRKPMSYAYVAITLDNSDHQLATSYDEVTVARRVYRSGESEYLMNGNVCRLKEISELFYDTGIGKEGYSIIGQGQIDRILSGKPEERRELFDEAAGIVKFKKRKNAAQKKLDSERENLVRVTDILNELERQVGPLENQAQKARIYLRKREELKNYDVRMFRMESGRIDIELKEAQQSFDTASSQMQQTEKEYQAISERNTRLGEQLNALDGEIEEIRSRMTSDSEEKLLKSNEIALLREQIHTAEISDEHYAGRLAAIDREIEEKKLQKEFYRKEQEKINNDAAGKVTLEEAAEKDLLEIQSKIASENETIEDSNRNLMALLERNASIKGSQQHYDTMLQQLNIRKAKLTQRLVASQSQEADYSAAFEEAKEAEKKAQEALRRIREKEIAVLNKEIARKENIRSNEAETERTNTDYHRVYSRLETLKNIAERYDGYGNSIRRVMEQKPQNPGLIGVVSDLIHVDRRYEVAIETALGGSIQNIVTEDEDTAKRMIAFLKENRHGRATFLPLTAVKTRSNPKNEQAMRENGVIGIASDLVRCDPRYQELSGYLLGRILIVDCIDNAVMLARKYRYSLHMVTLEGELLSPGGSMTGGAFKNSSNLLGRNREIDELTKELTVIKKKLQELHDRKEQMLTAQELCEDQLQEIREKLQEKTVDLNTAQVNLEHAQADKEEKENLFSDLQTEGSEIEKEAAEIYEKKKQIQEEAQNFGIRRKELEEKISEHKKQLEELRKQENDASRNLRSIQLALAELQKSLQFSEQNIYRIDDEIQKNLGEKENILNSSRDNTSSIEEKKQRIADVTEEISHILSRADQNELLLKEEQRKKEDVNIRYQRIFQEEREISEQKSALDKEIFRLQSRLDKLSEEEEKLISYMWEEYELTPHQICDMQTESDLSLTELKKLITQAKDEIRRLGNVNVNAIEEFRDVNERYQFMKTQHEDLITAEKTLLDVIRELDVGMRRQFTEKFADIQREFDAAFRQLFGGGHGTLELVEGEDVLECGIRIIAQPPGKKLQNMMQLSGGEKALSAIALLFAIQALKPSPFCLLDEIEAALDDSNVDRYAGYLNKLTENTQFIVITHRRGTMVAADRLYGITMQEKGVSTLVSVNLIDDQLSD